MTDGHCFISYSNADGLSFASQLTNDLQGRHPNIKVWFDKNDLDAGEPWDTQIAEAIRACKCLVFVMTDDSVTDNSVCKDEWTWALKYKKPIIPLHFHSKADLPFRLNNLQYIEFARDFTSGISQLRERITDLDSPKGILAELKHRLADANRDLRRAKDDDKLRIQAEIEELTKQIETQENIVRNPKAAEEKTEKNIQSGLERERQPEKPVAGKTSTRFINPPPGIAPTYFQDRLIETKQIADFLHNGAQRLMTIVGRAGVGKTAMICRLLKGIESGKLPDELGDMKADGIVYLSEIGSHRINFANIFADLSKLLPNETAAKLEGVYKDPQAPTGDKMRKLLDAFESGRFILLLDNFENLIDSESLHIKDSELSDGLNALLQATQHTVKVIITTRIAPRDLALVEPGRQHHLSLDDGLESPYAENVLREMDVDGRVGLKSAPDALLNKARERTRGYPRALEALYAILSVDRYTTLEELLEISLPDEVVQKLVGEAFNRLDPSAQKVMQALAVYNRPVSPAAIDYLLQPHLPSIDSALVLNRLVNMHFARREAGRYYLHPADKEYAFSIIPVKDLTTKDTKVTKENQEESSQLIAFSQRDLLNRAADYFAQARKPHAEWKKLDDLSAQLAEFDLRCEAGDYDTAASVLLGFDFDYLLLWGHYRLMIDLHLRMKDKITDKKLLMGNLNGLGIAHNHTGKVKECIDFYQSGLDTAREIKDRSSEGVFLGNLGLAYADLGDSRKAIEFHQQALVIGREIGNRKSEGAVLGNLGNAYADLGDALKAIEFHQQALVIDREIGNRKGEGEDLNNIAVIEFDSGNAKKSIEYLEKALKVAQEIGDRSKEGSRFGNIGEALTDLGKYEEAIEHHLQAQDIAKEIEDVYGLQYNIWGESQAYLFQKNLVKARTIIEATLQYDVPQNNHNASALHGIIALRQGERETAQEAFAKSIAQADEILAKTPDYYDALDAKGIALSGLVVSGQWEVESEKQKMIAEAVETFRKARKIAPHAGVARSVLRLFDELVKCDEDGILKDVREAAEGK